MSYLELRVMNDCGMMLFAEVMECVERNDWRSEIFASRFEAKFSLRGKGWRWGRGEGRAQMLSVLSRMERKPW